MWGKGLNNEFLGSLVWKFRRFSHSDILEEDNLSQMKTTWVTGEVWMAGKIGKIYQNN